MQNDVRSSGLARSFTKLVAAHVLRDEVNERIGRLTAELKELCFSVPGMKTDEGNENQNERLP